MTTGPDAGAADPGLTGALEGWRDSPSPAAAARVHARLLAGRLLVGVRASRPGRPPPEPGALDPAAPPAGLTGERAADVELMLIHGRDGRSALPAFTSLEHLARWRADARPVAAPGAAVLETAVNQGHGAVVVDVAGPITFVVEGQDLHDLADGFVPVVGAEDALSGRSVAGGLTSVAPPPTPSVAVQEAIASALASEPLVAEAYLLAASGGTGASGAALGLVLRAEIEASELVAMVKRVAALLGSKPFVSAGLDIAVLTAEQRRQAHALGPAVYVAETGAPADH